MRLIDADKLKMTTITRWSGDVDFVVYKEELDNAPTVIAEKQTEPTDGDLRAEIDKLPRIKVGNSNSPTVKYCIDENLIYDLLDRYKGEAVGEMTKEEAIEIIKGRNFYCIECIDRSDECCKALDMAIEELSADNTAEWVSKEGIFGAAYCSKCDYELRTNDTNYCPNCGRRMKGADS